MTYMKMMYYFIAIILFVGCNNLDKEEPAALIENWLSKTERYSKEYDLEKGTNSFSIIIREQSKVGSPIIEEISSDNLMYFLSDYFTENTEYDTVNIYIDLPREIAVTAVTKQKAASIYSYSRRQIALLVDLYSQNPRLTQFSDFVSFSVPNSLEVDLMRSGNLANEILDWYSIGNITPISVLYGLMKSYPQLSKDQTGMLSLAAVYRIGLEADFANMEIAKKMFAMGEAIPIGLEIEELDENARKLKYISPND